MSKIFPVNKLIDKISEYVKIKGEKIKLEITGHVARILAQAIIFSLIGIIALFLYFFVCLTISIILNSVLESDYLGYLIVSGVIFVKLIVLLMLLKSGKLQNWLESTFIKTGEDD